MKEKVGLIYNASRKENFELIDKIEKFLHSKGISTWHGKTGVEKTDWEFLKESLDFAIVLGGDGTLLGASRILAPKGIPMFGVNTGHLGFLTEGRPGNILELIEKILSNEYRIEERAMLCGYILSSDPLNSEQGPMFALNDIIISRGTNYKMIHMTLNVDDKPVADYIADGLIISTPTGSTAYALSAGGAVMDPGIHGIEIVPICAHSLTNRPHIVADNRILTITFNKQHEGTILQIDGQETFTINNGRKVRISRAAHTVKLLRLLGDESEFYWTIRKKFHWGSLAK
ncbi:MAG: NAD(+)/NADH kinase [Candidatus Melainabacteria bacterium]|nr:NAD(+)/NADH kinase [Candidatus Melainabacteria bacterium]